MTHDSPPQEEKGEYFSPLNQATDFFLIPRYLVEESFPSVVRRRFLTWSIYL